MHLSSSSDITDMTQGLELRCDQAEHFLTARTGDCMYMRLAGGPLKLSVTAVRLWSEFKSSAPRWLLSICQLRGVCGRLSLRGSGAEKERDTLPCSSIWHSVAHLRFLWYWQWGTGTRWHCIAPAEEQKTHRHLHHSEALRALLRVWALEWWEKAMQMFGFTNRGS